MTPTLKILEEIMKKTEHDHRFELTHFDGAESVFSCVLPGCTAIVVEPEDAGTGA